jgi:hypothetical protein
MTRLDILGHVYNGQSESMRWIQLSRCPRSFIHLSYSPFLLIRWVTSYIFKNHNGPFWLTHHQKKLKLGKPPKIIVFMWGGNSSPLPKTYIGERRTTFAKTYGVKVRCYWELFGEHAKNLGIFYFDSHHPKKKLAWKIHYPSGKWTMGSPLSTLNTTWK